MKVVTNKISILAVLMLAMLFTQCIDEQYDEPPQGGADPDFASVSTLFSVADVMDFWVPGQAKEVSLDGYLKGIILADDQSGNLYKTLIIGDETGGISVIIDDVELYNIFFEGRNVFVDLTSIWIGDFNGNPQLGMSPSSEGFLSRIPGALVDVTLFPGQHPQEIPNKILKINELNSSALNTLVTLEDVQFIAEERNVTYADAVTQFSLNRTLEDCDGNMVIVRTSGFSNFADQLTPSGKGSITAIYTVFGSTKQLLLRDLKDVNLTGDTCDGSSGGGGGGGGGGGTDECGITNECSASANVDESFEGYEDFENVSIDCWDNVGVVACRLWYTRSFDDDGFVETEAYQIDDAEMESWLITPAIDLAQASSFSFTSAVAFHNHDGLSVWISTNYAGEVGTASWSALSPILANGSSDNYEWVASGDVDLSSFSGIARIGFKYVGNPNNQTTKVRINDLKIN